jgi:DNA polymerase-3 subunit chi
MGEVFFYHLTETPLDEVLLTLVSRARTQGWRVELRGRDPARMVALDAALWRGPGDAFLPHGLAGGPHDALQPVLLSTAPAPGPFACIMAIDGADLAPAEVAPLARACILFDGNDDAATERARDQWRLLTAAGLGAKYWAQEGARWVMKSERAPG